MLPPSQSVSPLCHGGWPVIPLSPHCICPPGRVTFHNATQDKSGLPWLSMPPSSPWLSLALITATPLWQASVHAQWDPDRWSKMRRQVSSAINQLHMNQSQVSDVCLHFDSWVCTYLLELNHTGACSFSTTEFVPVISCGVTVQTFLICGETSYQMIFTNLLKAPLLLQHLLQHPNISKTVCRHELWRMSAELGLDLGHEQSSRRFSDMNQFLWV